MRTDGPQYDADGNRTAETMTTVDTYSANGGTPTTVTTSNENAK